MTSKSFCAVLKLAMLSVLIALLLGISTCKTPEVVMYPVDLNQVTVQKLPNGNCEVKDGMVYNYVILLAENKILKARIKELEGQ